MVPALYAHAYLQASLEAAKKAAKCEVETKSDQGCLAAIRERYGNRAERLIAMMLMFDALFHFREVMRLRIDGNIETEREEHALDFAQARKCRVPACPRPPFCHARAARPLVLPASRTHPLPCARVADRMWWEAFERVTLGGHKSFYPHRTQLTATAQILELGDLWDYSLSALESYHAG